MTGFATVLACMLAMAGGAVAPLVQPTGPELPTSVVRVGMTHVDGLVVVPVRIDGKGPFLFRLDTGSSVPLAIDAALAERLGHEPTAASFELARLDLGGATFRDVTAVALAGESATAAQSGTPGTPGATAAASPAPTVPSASAVHGVLGFPFFRDVLLTIDYAGGAIELRHGSLSSDDDGVLPMVGATGTPQVPMQVGDHVYLTRIDTGFADNVALPLHAASEVRTEGAPATVGRVLVDGQSREARSARLSESLLVAGRRYDRLPVLFAELPSGARIGYGLLAYFTLTFDQAAGLVRITPADSAG